MSLFKKKYERECKKNAILEDLVESKTRELYIANQSLELKVDERTKDLNKKHKELLIALEELNNANQAKEKFISIMSHELRTPLNSIFLLSDSLCFSPPDDPEEIKEIGTIILDCGKDLLSLIDDILDFAKIESGQLDIYVEDVGIRDCVNGVIKMVVNVAKKKGIVLDVKLDDNLPEMVPMDEKRFKQIMKNLLSNAIKYTNQGVITVSLSYLNDEVRIIVEDTGIGIAKNKLDTIFEPFTQIDSVLTRKSTGTGLGLAIIKSIVEVLNGRIEVTSTVNKGSCFAVFLPVLSKGVSVKYSADSMDSVDSIDSDNIDGQTRRVMVIDDNKRNLFSMKRLLSLHKIKTITVGSAAKALEILDKDTQFDLILTDIMMPEMDGYGFLATFKENSKQNHIPVVAITANATEGEKQKCMEAGFSDFILKPIKGTALLKKINAILNALL